MTAHVLKLEATPLDLPRRLRRLLGVGLTKVSAAHEARRRYQELADREVRDAGLSRDVVLGLPKYQPDLPFFMQPGFGMSRT
jgi:hypothetical protein